MSEQTMESKKTAPTTRTAGDAAYEAAEKMANLTHSIHAIGAAVERGEFVADEQLHDAILHSLHGVWEAIDELEGRVQTMTRARSRQTATLLQEVAASVEKGAALRVDEDYHRRLVFAMQAAQAKVDSANPDIPF